MDAEYTAALGLAAYCFASLEWNAVYCGQKLSEGYVATVGEKTAGKIATDILGFAAVIDDPAKHARFLAAAEEFRELVKRRNDLMHANPATVLGRQRLYRRGRAWEIPEIEELADAFTACSIELNHLFHRVL